MGEGLQRALAATAATRKPKPRLHRTDDRRTTRCGKPIGWRIYLAETAEQATCPACRKAGNSQ